MCSSDLILKGLEESAVTMFQLDEGVDSGPILYQAGFSVAPDETATTLYSKVSDAHRTAIREVWPGLEAGILEPIPQDESRATYWKGRTPDDGEIRETMRVVEVDRLVRATTRPYPGAFVERANGRLRIWAGRPASADPYPAAGVVRLGFADGEYDVTDAEFEPSPDAMIS